MHMKYLMYYLWRVRGCHTHKMHARVEYLNLMHLSHPKNKHCLYIT